MKSLKTFSVVLMFASTQVVFGLTRGQLGIDVSNHNGKIDWNRVKSTNIKFAITKATEGATYRDPTLVANYNGARRAGLRVGLYHYFRMSATVAAQFANLQRAFNEVKFNKARDILAIDFEITAADPGLKGPKTLAQKRVIADRLYQLLEMISRKLGVKPFVYTNPNSWNVLMDPNRHPFNKYRLWVAHYTTAARPTVPRPWTQYHIWQYTSKGQVNGINGNVDMNRVGIAF
jgi:lysozyme